ncbi:Inositol 2-dehydrogenase/D-chiro-inositol 3-dehydrogenase [Stieleria neptunia]|uniref:Inositol 2-dehydrogenase/D-chiro-inositol 3-dehydrogenase n=2 Tax=Stieleria neptunia TaxID=2527979 RepID=A0A518HV80_9BACT|nr:Inositol 2-dehydrogenase/D-chiro-inositol 3-dehydrogenase [Stieleria neptunia]
MIAGGAIGGAVAVGKAVQGGSNAPIKIAIVGCGRRARELADAVWAVDDEAVQLVGLADYFPSQTQSLYRSLKGRYGGQITANCVRSGGADCLNPILDSDADIVYVTTPPVDRPDCFRKIVEAGKHAFLEKPLAADAAGVLQSIDTAEQANAAGLTVHVGFQRRYDHRYQDVIERVRNGAVGTPVFARAFCNAGSLRPPTRAGNESDADFQRRNWNHFQWTGGDFLVEQHVAGLDVIRWALDQAPFVAQGQGGWGTFDTAEHPSLQPDRSGEVFDHHTVEFEFTTGAVLMSQCRRVAKSWNNTSEHVHGTLGRADLSAGKIYSLDGNLVWQSDRPSSLKTATVEQQRAFLGSIRRGAAENQVESAAASTLMAMLGHQATRTGKRLQMLKWINEAKFHLQQSSARG